MGALRRMPPRRPADPVAGPRASAPAQDPAGPAIAGRRTFPGGSTHALGFCGYSGSGKTTLIERLIGSLRDAGSRVSVIKHAHAGFDIDQPGKDSWRHRAAGAFEVLLASDRRLAKLRDYRSLPEPTLHELMGELSECDWVLVEGFRHAGLPKLETWRAAIGKPVQYPIDPDVFAVATDDPTRLPQPTALPVFRLDEIDAITRFLRAQADRCAYPSRRPPRRLASD